MNTTTERSQPFVLYWLIRGVLLESIRRRELYVVLLFMGLFLVGSLVTSIVGAESRAAATLMFNLGLTLSWTLTLIMTILMASRQFPDELEQRSLYPLLAKPVERSQYVLGKWLATWICGSVTATLLSLVTLVFCPRPKGLSLGLFGQSLALQNMAIGMIAIIAIALSIRVPKALTMVLSALLVFGGGHLLRIVRGAFSNSKQESIITWLSGYIPDFGRLDVINALSAGAPPLTALDFLGRLVIAGIFAAFAYALGVFLLTRRSL